MALSKDQIDQILIDPSLMRLIRKSNEIQQVVDEMVARATDAHTCVAVAMYSIYADSILRGLKERFKGTQHYISFVSGVANIHPELIGSKNPMKWDLMRDLLSEVEALTIIANGEVIDEENPILKRLNWDLYWESRFLHFLRRGNFKRVWDAIKQARWGLFLRHRLPTGKTLVDYDGCWSDRFRAFPATRPLLSMMMRRLFGAMTRNGIIKPINPSDPTPDWDSLHTRVPGIWIASVLPYPEWYMALIIGAHFSKATNAKKRAKVQREIARG